MMEHRNYITGGIDEDFPTEDINRNNRAVHFSGAVRVSSKRISHGADMDIQIRNIETAAYSAVLRAFNAQSEVLTWEKEGLMSELRKELRVSDVEHRETLLKINTDDSIKMIRELRKGGNSQKEMSANATSHASHKRFKVSHVVVSSSPKYPTPSQPSSAAIHSSLATQFKGAQSYSEGAIVSIKENTKESAKSVGHNRRESDTTKGMRSLQLKSNSVVQFSDAIEIRATDKLIHEIEKVICGEEIPKLAQVEKAKSILKEQERAILEALDKLSSLSHGNESPTHSRHIYSNEEQQRHGQHMAADQGFYQQAVRTEGYYD